MKIEISCSCGKEYQVSPDLLGKQVKCKACGKAIAVELQIGLSTPDPEPEEPKTKATAKNKTKSSPKAKRKASSASTPTAPTGKKPKTGKSKTGKKRRPPPTKSTSPVVLLGGIAAVAAALLIGVYLFVQSGQPDEPAALDPVDVAPMTSKPAVTEDPKHPGGWVSFKPPDGGYEVLMPKKPRTRVDGLQSPAGSLEMHIAVVDVEGGDVSYQVTHWDYPLEVGKHEALTEASNELVRGLPKDREDLTENVIKHSQGSPGRDLRATFFLGEKTRSQVSYFYLVKKTRLIVLTTITAEGAGSLEEKNRFLDSLQIFDW